MTTESAQRPESDLCGFRFPLLLNPWFLAAGTVALGVVSSLSTYIDDEALWGYCGWLWAAHGDPPYRCAFENKPVGILLLYRFSWSLFGSAMPVTVAALADAGTALMLYMNGRRYQGRVGGAIAALVFGLFTANRITDGEGQVCTETFMLFCTMAAVSLLLKVCTARPPRLRWLYLLGIGLALGAALCFKQTAIADIIGLVPLCFVAVRRGSTAGGTAGGAFLILLGAAAAAAAGFLPLAASGVSLREYWQAVVGSPFVLRGTQDVNRHAMQFVRDWTASPLVLCYPLALSYLLQRKELRASGVPYWGLLFWLGMAFAGANASADLWYHQFKQAILPISLVAGLGLGSFVQSLNRSAPRALAWIYLSLVAMLFPYQGAIVAIGDHVLPHGVSRPGKSGDETARRIAADIQAQTEPADYIFVWQNECNVQFYARRRSSSRYFNTRFHLMPDFEARLAADLAAHPPEFIYIDEDEKADPPPPRLRELLATSYARYRKIDRFQGYRRTVAPQ